MKKPNLFLAVLSTLFVFAGVLFSRAQEYTATNYYYNNFDGGAWGAAISQASANASLELTNSSPLSGTYSLSSLGNGQVGSYRFSFIPGGTSMNDGFEKNGWEWTMIYRNSGVNPDDPTTIDNNENSWRYWLYADNTNLSDMKGYYITQKGSSIVVSQRENQNTSRDFFSYDLSQLGGNNVTYVIRVQRISKNGYAFRLFIDQYTSSTKEATTLRGESNSGNINNYNSYNYSGLQVSSTTNGRFKFDEIKMYSRKIEIMGITDPASGFSTSLYDGQKDAVVYALKFRARGLFTEVYQVKAVIEQTGHNGFDALVENPRLFRSHDNYLGNSDDVLIDKNQWNGAFAPTVGWRSLEANNFQTQTFHSIGTLDGLTMDVGCLFFKVDVKSDASGKGVFNVKNITLIGNDNASINYVAQTNVVVEQSTSPAAAGNIYDWVGSSSAVWSDKNNWRLVNDATPSGAPGINDLVRIGINKSYSRMPVISGNANIGSLTIGGSLGTMPVVTINSGASLVVVGTFNNQRASVFSGNGSFEVGGNWVSSGGKIDLTAGNVSVNFNGAKQQLVKDEGSDSGKGVVFGNVVFSGGGAKTLSGTGRFAVGIGKFLTMGANTMLQASGLLTLKSNAEGYASVGSMPSTSSIQGQVTVEKYIQGGSKDTWRTNRLLSSPIYDNTASFTSVDNDGGRKYSFTQFIDDVLITGAGGVANGFDVNARNEASAWTYIGAFSAIPRINTSLNVGRGALIYYRGDRSNPEGKMNAPYVDAESIVMTFTGTLNQQNVTVSLVGNNLLGNPYAAAIDWHAVTKSANIGDVIKVWNPENRQYSVYNGEYGINKGSRYIASGQGFFVQLTNTSAGSVTFNEAAKVNSSNASSLVYNRLMSVSDKTTLNSVMGGGGSVVAQEQPAKLRVLLTRDNTENSDETLVVLRRNEEAAVAGGDVLRSGGEEVFLSSLSSDGKKMAINYMPHVSAVSSVKLGVDMNNNGNYKISFKLDDVPVGYEAKLKDNYLNTITDISKEDTNYAFAINKSVPTSFGNGRFEVVFKPITTLPVVVSDFSGAKVNEGVLIKWKTSSEINNSHFEILRSGEDKIFVSQGIVAASNVGSYSLLDRSPVKGNNYYKLVQVDNGGSSNTYKDIVVVKYDLDGRDAEGLLAYPTVVENTLNLKYNGALMSNICIVNITDVTGKSVYKGEVEKSVISDGYAASLARIASGVYFVELLDPVVGKRLGVAKISKK